VRGAPSARLKGQLIPLGPLLFALVVVVIDSQVHY
jgi:hypothetical protein